MHPRKRGGYLQYVIYLPTHSEARDKPHDMRRGMAGHSKHPKRLVVPRHLDSLAEPARPYPARHMPTGRLDHYYFVTLHEANELAPSVRV